MARLAVDANKRENKSYVCRHICVEPFEQPWLEKIDVTVLRTKIEELDASIVENLAPMIFSLSTPRTQFDRKAM
jgi:hypothetical protein